MNPDDEDHELIGDEVAELDQDPIPGLGEAPDVEEDQ